MNLPCRRERRWIWAAVAAAFLARVGFGTLYWVDKPLTHDEREYLALATSLTQGRGFTYDTSHEVGTAPRFGRAPGYPVFLALIGAGTGQHESTPLGVKIAQALVGALTVLVIGMIGARAAGPRAGAIAAGIAAIYPPLVWICSYVLSEALYALSALSAAHLLQLSADAAAGAGRRWRAASLALLSGLVAGTAILVRPAMILFVVLAGAWLLKSRRFVLLGALIAGTAILVAPWTIRNASVHGRLILVASEGGVTFWTGNHPLARGEGDLAANPPLKLAELEFRRAHGHLSPEELEPLYYRAAFQWIAENPGHWLVLLARKAFYTVVPVGPSYTLHSTRYWAASLTSYGLVLPFALAGFRRLWRDSGRPSALLLLGASAVLVGLVFFPQERFRIPVIDPVLIILAGAAVAGLTSVRDREGALV